MAEVHEESTLEREAGDENVLTDVESICTLSDTMSNYELSAELKADMSIRNIDEFNSCKESFTHRILKVV